MAWRRRFRSLFGLQPRADVEQELAFHLEMRVKELIERGESPPRARALALSRFGNYEATRHQCEAINERRRRRMRRTEYFSEVRQDVGYALRLLKRTPGFTLVAMATLALGIGATSAIFSVVHGVLLESLPYRAADRLHLVQMLYPDGTVYNHLSAPDFMSVQQSTQVFEQVDAFSNGVWTLVEGGEPREVQGANVGRGLFELLGMPVVLGRGFLPAEHEPKQGQVAVLDHGFWTRAFGGDPSVIGRTLSVGANRPVIVGVLAPGARLPMPIDVYMPIEYTATFDAATAQGRRGEFLNVIGRARAGVGPRQIDDDLKRLGADLQRAFPDTNERLTFASQSVRDVLVGDVQAPLLMLLGAVGLVLLVACANVANLLLARGSVRQGELAVRSALGAARGRLLRQLLTESLVLAIAGGTLGLALAYLGATALVAAQPADIPRLEEVGVNGPVVFFTLAIALVTSVLFGMLPALQATRIRLKPALGDGARGGTSRGGQRVRGALVVAEMALAVVLLVGAGLLARSFIQLTRVDLGFTAAQAMAFRVPMQGEAYPGRVQILQRIGEIEARLRTLPGVTAVGATTLLPLSGRGGLIDFMVEGAPPPREDVNQEIGIASVAPDYFRAIGTPLVKGRLFTDRDGFDAPRVALVNQAAARFWFPDGDPLGRRVTMSGTSYEVVGVVGDAWQRDPGQRPLPQIFVPIAQRTSRTTRFVVRANGDALALAGAIRAEIRALDPNLPVADIIPLDQLLTRSVARPRFYTMLLTLFAAVALTLAATGIFGMMSYTVAQRSREIGIRMALGAHASGVLRMIVGSSLALAGAGMALGLVAALALGRFIQNQLFGVTLLDPVTVSGVLLVLLLTAGMASYLPARRAATVDPAGALREG